MDLRLVKTQGSLQIFQRKESTMIKGNQPIVPDRTIILSEADLQVCSSVDEAFEDDFDTIVSKRHPFSYDEEPFNLTEFLTEEAFNLRSGIK
jgi:hypothetical protein